MIVASRKPLDEIIEIIGDYSKILIAGCGTCVEVCHAGGEKEVEILASQLRMKFRKEGIFMGGLPQIPEFARKVASIKELEIIREHLDAL